MSYDCYKCGGTGQTSFHHIAGGVCFTCGGTGKLSCKAKSTNYVDPGFPKVPEAERATPKQWDYFNRLVGERDDTACRIIRAQGAVLANAAYVTRAQMSRAIEAAKKLEA